LSTEKLLLPYDLRVKRYIWIEAIVLESGTLQYYQYYYNNQMGNSFKARASILLVLFTIFFSCKKDLMKRLSNIEGMHTWVGIRHSFVSIPGWGSNESAISFVEGITVVNDNMIIFPYEPGYSIDTLYYLKVDKDKKTITFTGQWEYNSSYESHTDTMVYYYSGDSITYSRDEFDYPVSNWIRVSTKL
jgi:hypothetical protein